MVNRRRVLEACDDLHQSFGIAPCTVVKRASHTAHSDRHPCVEILVTLRTMNRFDVLSPEPLNYLFITLTSPLILASPLRVVKLVA